MAQGCGGSFAKFLLILLNLLFWLSGAALVAIGIWLLVDPTVVEKINDIVILTDNELIKYSAYLLLGVGGFVFIVAFVGCCGAFKEHRGLLTIYIILLFLVMAAELAAGILAYLYRDHLEEEIQKVAKKKLGTSPYPSDSFWRVMDLAQSKFRCCGLNNASDYTMVNWKQYNNLTSSGPDQPYSCCALKSTYSPSDNINSTMVKCNPEGPFPTGCMEKLIEMVESKLLLLIAIGIGLACFQVLMFIFAICLCRRAEPKS